MSLNKAALIGNLGAEPEIRTMQSGDEVCNLSIATTEKWKDRNTGEQKEKTEWHRVVIFSPGLVNVVKNYLKKGSKVYLEGKIQTRSWEQDGQKKYSTEIVLNGFEAKLVMLSARDELNDDTPITHEPNSTTQSAQDLEDEIPF